MSSNDRKNFLNIDRLQWISDTRVAGPRALILLIVGIILILIPGTILTTLIRIIGAAAALFGVYLGLSWYRAREGENASMAAAGAVLLLIGIFLFTSPHTFVSIFPIAAGIVILINGAVHLAEALNLRKTGSDKWLAAAILSGITLVLGIVMLANPFSVMTTLVRVLGFVLIYNGVTGLFISKQMH